MRNFIDIITESAQPTLPDVMKRLAAQISTKTWDAAKRLIVSKVGSVQRGERFDDDVADAVFLRIQRTSQVGQYNSEEIVKGLNRKARRLEGDDTITLYRAAPKGGGIRPGDFCSPSKDETGYYMHGGHVLLTKKVPSRDVIAVDGTLGGGQELVYLPVGHEAIDPVVFYPTFRDFYEASSDI